MMFVNALLLTVITFIVDISAKGIERSYELEEPPYVLWGEQPKDKSYEIRRYNTSVWASTNLTAFSEHEATEKGFSRLFQYISGHNKGGISMPMTAPVAVDVYESPCVFCPRTYMVSFYIPRMHEADPPEPSDEKILIVTYPEFVAYTRQFRTHLMPYNYLKEAYILNNLLAKNNVTTVEKDKIGLASYDPPFKPFFLQKNEVWMYYYEGEEPEIEEEGQYFVEEENYVRPRGFTALLNKQNKLKISPETSWGELSEAESIL